MKSKVKSRKLKVESLVKRYRGFFKILLTLALALSTIPGCGLVDADRGVNVVIEDLGGPYNVDLAYTDDDGDATTPPILNSIPDLTFSLASNVKVASNSGFTDVLDDSSTDTYADYYITGYTISYAIKDFETATPGTVTNNVGGLAIHIQNGETFTASGANVQVLTNATRERLIATFGSTGSFDVLATITFTGYTEDSRSFSIKGYFDIKFDEFAPES